MSRTARKKSGSGVYHVVLRGNNKQTIFYDDEDQEVFLNRIKLAKEKYMFDLYSFCLMGNHVHLLVREREATIGRIMQYLLASYVFWYNSKYERVGNLFQDRYKSEPIDSDSYLLCATRYIHQNPLKAGVVREVGEYRWSSYGAYLSDKESIVDTEVVLSMLQGKDRYVKFMHEIEENTFLEPSERFRISDEKLIQEIKKRIKIEEMREISSLPRQELAEKLRMIFEIKGSNPYQISRVTGVSMGIIRTILV